MASSITSPARSQSPFLRLPFSSALAMFRHLRAQRRFDRKAEAGVLELDRVGTAVVLAPLGPGLRASEGARLRQSVAALSGQSGRAPDVVVDLGRIHAIDSAGLSALLGCLRDLRVRGARLVLSGLRPPVRVLVELVRVHRLVEVHLTAPEALEALEALKPESSDVDMLGGERGTPVDAPAVAVRAAAAEQVVGTLD